MHTRGPASAGIAHRRALRRGFTLIELLVVIAIIAILAAILFPVFAQAREAARKTACLSNCKQMGTGVMMYSQDYDEILPAAGYSYNSSISVNDLRNPKWMDVVQPYVKNDHIFDCPSDTATKKFVSLATNPNRGTGTNPPGGSYLINTAYNGGGALAGPAGQSLAVIGSPADTIFIAEGPSVVNNQFYWSSGAAAPNPPLTPFATYPATSGSDNNSFHMDTKAAPAYFGYQDSTGRRYLFLGRHNNQGNLVFCDGHAKSETVDKPSATHNVNGKNIFYRWSSQDD